MRRTLPLIVIIIGLPILFPLINPSMELGSEGLVMGLWGTYLSPLTLFGYLIYQLFRKEAGR